MDTHQFELQEKDDYANLDEEHSFKCQFGRPVLYREVDGVKYPREALTCLPSVVTRCVECKSLIDICSLERHQVWSQYQRCCSDDCFMEKIENQLDTYQSGITKLIPDTRELISKFDSPNENPADLANLTQKALKSLLRMNLMLLNELSNKVE